MSEVEKGRTNFRAGRKNGKVVLEFACPVSTVELTPEQALRLSKAILELAQEINQKNQRKIN